MPNFCEALFMSRSFPALIMPNLFDQTLDQFSLSLTRKTPEILQVNVGKMCNLTCVHCHVNAGPARKEIMTRETVDKILDWLANADTIHTVDLTGGAPEMNPEFKHFVRSARALGKKVIDRCNLTILTVEGYEDYAQFMADNEVEIVASLPCYSADNVEEQRGEGVFDSSIEGLQILNKLGYGSDPALQLHLVYNPNGAFLPGDQAELEADYKSELKKAFGIVFNQLFTITNIPIARYASYLKRNKQLAEYMQLLVDNFNPASVAGLMCRNTINVGWKGEVYDCDFNQQLHLQLEDEGKVSDVADHKLFAWDVDSTRFTNLPIQTGSHCFGCTAGAGSSCGGALL